ncbi:bleomycin resistance protein [Aureimonas pseudogalii]
MMPEGGIAALTPELDVLDPDASLSFWCGLLGFEVAYDRPAARFAFLARGRAQIMVCQTNGRWLTGPLERPLGRGVNFQIMVDRLDPILASLYLASWQLFENPSVAWYRIGDEERGQRECLVQDPDGYLVRLAENVSQRTL